MIFITLFKQHDYKADHNTVVFLLSLSLRHCCCIIVTKEASCISLYLVSTPNSCPEIIVMVIPSRDASAIFPLCLWKLPTMD